MDQHLLTPLIEPNTIAVWFDRATSETTQKALRERLRCSHAKVSFWPDVPAERIDLALIASAPESLRESLNEAATRQCKAAVILTSNVSIPLQNELRDEARRLGIALVGPASFGIQRPSIGLNASTCSTTALQGRVALLSQSGALASAILDWAGEYKVGFSAVITLGNECDVDLARTLDYLANDHETQAIVIYLECVANPRAFLSALRAAAGLKPVILLKAGATTHAPMDPLTHTQALVGSDDVFDAAIRRSGAVRVNYFLQLFAAVRVLTSNRPPNGRQLAVISNGRGPALLVQDLVRALNIRLPALPQHNPIIIRDDSDGLAYQEAIRALDANPDVDVILAIHSPHLSVDTEAITKAVAQASATTEKLVIGCWLGDQSTREARNWLSSQGVPAFRTPEAAVDALHALTTFKQNQELLQQISPVLSLDDEPDLDGARMIIEGALADRRHTLTEMESKSLLSAFGIAVSTTISARSANESALIAHQIGFPVALKINSPDIIHKSEVDGVRLNLKTAQEVREAFDDLTNRVRELAPTARIEGVVVQKFIERSRATEAHIGMATDPLFGPVISFGPGGEKVRWVRDRALELPPLNGLLAQRLIERTQLGQTMLEQQAHQDTQAPHPAIEKLERLLLKVSDLVCELPAIREIDINPVIVSDQDAIVLDARMVIESTQGQHMPRYGHLSIMPYPAHLTAQYPLPRDGTYEIRPIRWNDSDRLNHLLANLSEESRFMRFLANVKSFTPKQLARFTQIDYHRDMALVATVGRHDQEELIGVARYALLPNAESAEFALVVADAYQNQGIGSKLMKSLIDVARDQHLQTIEGYVLANNGLMLRLMTKLGFEIEPDPDDATMRRVVKSLEL